MRGSDIEAVPLQNTMSTSTSNVAHCLPDLVTAPGNGHSASCAPSEAPPSYEEAVTRASKPAISEGEEGEEGQPPPYSL